MGFTVKEEYERLNKIQSRQKDGLLPFECGCVCGVVTRIKYLKPGIRDDGKWHDDEIEIYVIAGTLQKTEQYCCSITADDVRRRYQDRKYRYDRKYNIFEFYPYKYELEERRKEYGY